MFGIDRNRSAPIVATRNRRISETYTYRLLIFVEIFLGNLEESRVKTNTRIDT